MICPIFFPGERTGNRLFQIAASYAHARRVGVDCRVDWSFDPVTSELGAYLDFPIPQGPGGCVSLAWQEPRYSYVPIPLSVIAGGLAGYYQSARYFNDDPAAIRQLYAPLSAPYHKQGVAGVHIRLGDYLSRPDMYVTASSDYLSWALGQLGEDIHTLVLFSDDPAMALQRLSQCPASSRYSIVVDNHDTLAALREMTSMTDLIMSCSSFSWWGAWLGRPRRALVEQRWFAGVIEDDQDVFCQGWRRRPSEWDE